MKNYYNHEQLQKAANKNLSRDLVDHLQHVIIVLVQVCMTHLRSELWIIVAAWERKNNLKLKISGQQWWIEPIWRWN